MRWYLKHDGYGKAQILQRLTEPDRILIYRVTWETDKGDIRTNRAWRVQFNHALGPYEDGLRHGLRRSPPQNCVHNQNSIT